MNGAHRAKVAMCRRIDGFSTIYMVGDPFFVAIFSSLLIKASVKLSCEGIIRRGLEYRSSYNDSLWIHNIQYNVPFLHLQSM